MPVLAARALIERIDEFFDGVFAPLFDWLPDLQRALAQRLASGLLTGAEVVSITEDRAHRILAETDRPLYGVGYCATTDMVAEGNPLAWWQGPDQSLLASSTFGPGQAAIDLQRLEWYRVPAATLQPHLAGPFVDYLCSNEITMTSTVPVMIDGAFSGVACADVLVESLEPLLLPEVARLGAAALVNASGRVILASDPGLETGDRLPVSWGLARREPSERYPFALVIAGI